MKKVYILFLKKREWFYVTLLFFFSLPLPIFLLASLLIYLCSWLFLSLSSGLTSKSPFRRFFYVELTEFPNSAILAL